MTVKKVRSAMPGRRIDDDLIERGTLARKPSGSSEPRTAIGRRRPRFVLRIAWSFVRNR